MVDDTSIVDQRRTFRVDNSLQLTYRILPKKEIVEDTKAMEDRIQEAVDLLASRITSPPIIGIILGTGLGGITEKIEIELRVPYEEIPISPYRPSRDIGVHLSSAHWPIKQSWPWRGDSICMKATHLIRSLFRSE